MKHIILTVLLLFSISVYGQELTPEQKAVKAEVLKTYIIPLYGGGSLDDLKAGLHEDFNMYVLYEGQFSKRSKKMWMDKMDEVRSRPKKAGPKAKNTWNFLMIDITGQTAVAKVEVFRNGKLNFTDYLTLYKFEDQGWKLLSKFFTSH